MQQPPGDPEPTLAEVGRLADEVLWPRALEIDGADRIPEEHYDRIADLGLFGMLAPPELGGLGYGVETVRRALRSLGRGCGATAFAFAQHGGVAAAVAGTGNRALRERWLPELCGRTLGGTAFAHVRRAGPAVVAASRIDGGWRVDGVAPWATSWGSAGVFSVAALTADDEVVWFLEPGRSSPSVVPSAPMDLVAFGATATVSLRFAGHEVADGDVLSVLDAPTWRVGDRRGAVRPNPLCMGVGDRALSELALLAPDEADRLHPWWADLTARAELAGAEPGHRSRPSAETPPTPAGEGADAGPSGENERAAEVARVRTEVVLGVQQLTTALLAAAGGQGADRSHPAQLLARQALFYVIQAQNADGRRATLDALVP